MSSKAVPLFFLPCKKAMRNYYLLIKQTLTTEMHPKINQPNKKQSLLDSAKTLNFRLPRLWNYEISISVIDK